MSSPPDADPIRHGLSQWKRGLPTDYWTRLDSELKWAADQAQQLHKQSWSIVAGKEPITPP
jgi:hypothetical protein